MGGGAINLDIPMPYNNTSPPFLPSLNPSSSSSSLNFPLHQSYACVACCNRHCQTEPSAGGNETELFHNMFGPAPSPVEVQTAISALQNFLRQIWSTEPDFQTLGGYGNGRVEEAFRLLLTDPITQRVVFSLSSDKAVWSAVMNNEMVLQLQESYVPKAHDHRIQGFNGESDLITWILDWIKHIIKAKVAELIEKFELLVDQIFIQTKGETQNGDDKDEIDDKIMSSFILSLVILLIVAVARFHWN